MTNDVTFKRFPWEPVPTEEAVALLQADLRYMVTHTGVMTHSSREALCVLVNTPRGQIIPRGTCTFTDGTTLEFQDVGMPQPGAKEMTVKELVAMVWGVAKDLGLELQQ